jgi:hypothetical protein
LNPRDLLGFWLARRLHCLVPERCG